MGEGEGDGEENPNEESFIEHEGKRYQRIQIEGLEAEEGEYLMDDQKNIYSLDFNFITNMNNEQIEGEDDDWFLSFSNWLLSLK